MSTDRIFRYAFCALVAIRTLAAQAEPPALTSAMLTVKVIDGGTGGPVPDAGAFVRL